MKVGDRVEVFRLLGDDIVGDVRHTIGRAGEVIRTRRGIRLRVEVELDSGERFIYREDELREVECVVCPRCTGTGDGDGDMRPTCWECDGTGQVTPGEAADIRAHFRRLRQV